MFSQFINLTLAGNGLMIAVQVSDISTFQEYYSDDKLVTLIIMKSGRTIIVDQLYEEVIRLIEEDDNDDWDDEDEEDDDDDESDIGNELMRGKMTM